MPKITLTHSEMLAIRKSCDFLESIRDQSAKTLVERAKLTADDMDSLIKVRKKMIPR